MQKNETILTPMFRLIFRVIETCGITEYLKCIEELKKIRSHLEVNESGIGNSYACLHIIDLVIDLFEKTSHESADAFEFWEESYQLIKKSSCTECFKCKKCKEYFWLEIRELFWGIKNPERENGIYFPVRKVPDQIQKCLEPSLSVSELYEKQVKNNRISEKNLFVVLKGMSSSTPAIMNSLYDTMSFSGGGFYLRLNGMGIAIDPGYHFIYNLQHYGYSILDIDVVIVTHEHIDHNNDMRLFDDLLSNVKRIRDRKMIWILDSVSYQMAKLFQENGTGFDDEYCILYQVNPESGNIATESSTADLESLLSQYRVGINYFPTKHIWDRKKNLKTHTFGCSFISIEDKIKIAYTSDTSYTPEMVKNIGACDVLIANISGIYEDDFMLVKAKERHLGYYGCYHLLEDAYRKYGGFPKLVLLSEFWNGKHDIRYDVVEQLKIKMRENGMGELNIVPAEQGMAFNPKNQHLRCSSCGKMTNKYIVIRPVEFNGKIQCFCENCFYRNEVV